MSVILVTKHEYERRQICATHSLMLTIVAVAFVLEWGGESDLARGSGGRGVVGGRCGARE